MSHSPGSTLMPSVEMTSAPPGTGRVPTVPTARMRSPSITITLLRSGGPPCPSMSVPPTSALTRPVCPSSGTGSSMTSARATAILRARFITPHDVEFHRLTVRRSYAPAERRATGGAGGYGYAPGHRLCSTRFPRRPGEGETVSEVNAVSGQVVDAAFHIHYQLGPGLLESVYERILERSLLKRGLAVERQSRVGFEFDGERFDNAFRADLIVER